MPNGAIPKAALHRASWWVKLSVTLVCAFLVWRHLRASSPTWPTFSLHPWHLAAAIVLRPAFTLTLALRIRCLTRIALRNLKSSTILRAAFIGQMANLALPGGAGGDIARGTMFWRETGRSWPRIIGVLVMDRLLGTISLLGVSALFGLPVLVRIVGPYKLAGAGVAGGRRAG